MKRLLFTIPTLSVLIMIIVSVVVFASSSTPITGHVVKNGKAVSGALVTAQCGNLATTAFSQDDGFYSLVVDDATDCVLHAEKNGWASSYVSVATSGWDFNGIDLDLVWYFPGRKAYNQPVWKNTNKR